MTPAPKRTRPLAGGRRFDKADLVTELYHAAVTVAILAPPIFAAFAIALLIAQLIARCAP